MNSYVVLLRGVNVGGKNKIAMTELRQHLEALGYENVATYIASGNIILDTKQSAVATAAAIQQLLSQKFKLDSPSIKALVLSHKQLKTVVSQAPNGFGQHPDTYHSDAVFVIDKATAEVMQHIETRSEVDTAWEGDRVVYFQRLSAQRTKSRLGRIISKPIYQSLTIRSWNTTTKLLDILNTRAATKP